LLLLLLLCRSQSSSASLAQRHLGPESQLVGHSFQQEFLSELDTGAELLQSHAQLLVGNALSHAVQQAMEAPPPAASPPHEAGLKVSGLSVSRIRLSPPRVTRLPLVSPT